MYELKYSKHGLFLVLIFLISSEIGQGVLWCEIEDAENEGPEMPTFPAFYSTNIQVNDETAMYSMDIRRAVDTPAKKSTTEVWSGKRHVKYVLFEKVLLTLEFNEIGTSCSSAKLSGSEVNIPYQSEENILLNIFRGLEKKIQKKEETFLFFGIETVKGIPVRQWQLCTFFPEIEEAVYILISFTDQSWAPYHEIYSPLPEAKFPSEIIQIKMKIPGKVMKSKQPTVMFTIDYSKFTPYAPAEDDFQPPEDVHCPGFRTDVQPPAFYNYFSYESEVLSYSTGSKLNQIASYQKVYYDFNEGFTRIDKQESALWVKNSLVPSTAPAISVIHNYNSGVRYTIDPVTGSCSMEELNNVLDAIGSKASEKPAMPDPMTFFSLKNAAVSYNGQYQNRGITTKVFSASVESGNGIRILHWHFATDKFQLVKDQQVEKSVLVRITSRSESDVGKKDVKEINLFNFVQDEPRSFVYDITSCFNESLSKSYILIFSGELQSFYSSSMTILKLKMHQMIVKVTGIRKQRVFIQQVNFRSPYLYVQFVILDISPVKGNVLKPLPEEKSLEEAVNILQEAVSKGNFNVMIRTKDNVDYLLKANTDGLTEFPLETSPTVVQEDISKGDAVGLAIGMLFVGLIIGAVLVNIFISKKHGVSLFQKPGFGGSSADRPSNESGF